MILHRLLCIWNSQCQSEDMKNDFISNIVLGTAETQAYKQTK